MWIVRTKARKHHINKQRTFTKYLNSKENYRKPKFNFRLKENIYCKQRRSNWEALRFNKIDKWKLLKKINKTIITDQQAHQWKRWI